MTAGVPARAWRRGASTTRGARAAATPTTAGCARPCAAAGGRSTSARSRAAGRGPPGRRGTGPARALGGASRTASVVLVDGLLALPAARGDGARPVGRLRIVRARAPAASASTTSWPRSRAAVRRGGRVGGHHERAGAGTGWSQEYGARPGRRARRPPRRRRRPPAPREPPTAATCSCVGSRDAGEGAGPAPGGPGGRRATCRGAAPASAPLDRRPRLRRRGCGDGRRAGARGPGRRSRVRSPATALEAAYAGGDLLVLPSRAETYGMVVTEALARGLPVLAATSAGCREALGAAPGRPTPGAAGPPVGDPAALAALAASVALRTRTCARRLRAAARERRVRLAGWSVTADRVAQVARGGGGMRTRGPGSSGAAVLARRRCGRSAAGPSSTAGRSLDAQTLAARRWLLGGADHGRVRLALAAGGARARGGARAAHRAVAACYRVAAPQHRPAGRCARRRASRGSCTVGRPGTPRGACARSAGSGSPGQVVQAVVAVLVRGAPAARPSPAPGRSLLRCSSRRGRRVAVGHAPPWASGGRACGGDAAATTCAGCGRGSWPGRRAGLAGGARGPRDDVRPGRAGGRGARPRSRPWLPLALLVLVAAGLPLNLAGLGPARGHGGLGLRRRRAGRRDRASRPRSPTARSCWSPACPAPWCWWWRPREPASAGRPPRRSRGAGPCLSAPTRSSAAASRSTATSTRRHRERLVLSNDADLARVDRVRADVRRDPGRRRHGARRQPAAAGARPRRCAEPAWPGAWRSRRSKVTMTRTAPLDAESNFFATGDSEKLVYCASASSPHRPGPARRAWRPSSTAATGRRAGASSRTSTTAASAG